MMQVWLLTVFLVYGNVNQVWLKQEYDTEGECREWQAFYSEYPFRPVCSLIKNNVEL